MLEKKQGSPNKGVGVVLSYVHKSVLLGWNDNSCKRKMISTAEQEKPVIIPSNRIRTFH